MEAIPQFDPNIVLSVPDVDFCIRTSFFFAFSSNSVDDCKKEFNQFLETYWGHLAADSFDEICINCQKVLVMLYNLKAKVYLLTLG
jgi:hypothetical protein